MKRPVHRILARALAAGLMVSVSTHVAATDIDYTLRLGLQHNDNLNSSETDPVSDNIFIPGFDFTVRQVGSRIRANLAGSIEYRDYLGGSYAGTTRAQLDGALDWVLVPDRLTWSFQDSLGVQPINELAADSPDNQQQTNAFATGPSLLFGRRGGIDGRFDLRYIDSYAEKTRAFDTRRTAAALAIGHDIDSTSRLSGNASVQKVRFKHDETGTDFTRSDLYAEYTRTMRQFDLELQLGYSRLSYDAPGLGRSGGPLLGASLGWRADARNTFSLALTRRFTDAADAMLGGDIATALPNGVNTGDASVTAQAYLQRSADLAWNWQGQRYGFSLSPYWHDYDYTHSSALDRTARGVTGGISYLLNPRLRFGLLASNERERYTEMGRSERNRSYVAMLDYQMTRRVGWNLSYTHFERRGLLDDQNGNQNVIYLQLILRR